VSTTAEPTGPLVGEKPAIVGVLDGGGGAPGGGGGGGGGEEPEVTVNC
jgi:hypothetical protein